MAHGGESNDFYAVLGLNKECTPSELRNAYKRLALKWHPDRCSASGNTKFVEDAKKKFQAIQQAYSVLSDENKRLMYDVGFYDSDDDENGMGDFLNEMATMMSQTKPNENGEESFQQLQDLFNEMFQENMGTFGSNSHSTTTFCSTSSSIYTSYSESSSSRNKRSASQMSFGNAEHPSSFDTNYQSFCLGVEHRQGTRKEKGGVGGRTLAGDLRSSRHRHCRKQKVSNQP